MNGELRTKCALAASRWLGTKEGSDGHRELLRVYNNIRPLPRGYTMAEGDPWCAAFASAAAVQAGAEALYPLECSCSKIIEKAQSMGVWVEDDSHRPEPGDWVLYNWEAQAAGDDTGKPDHVGVVIGMEQGQILVVEGNFDNAVGLRRIAVDDRRVRGFVCPRFPEPEGARPMRFRSLEEVPQYARPTIGKLLEDGSLRGVGEKDLGLTEELIRVLVILDRRGIL